MSQLRDWTVAFALCVLVSFASATPPTDDEDCGSSICPCATIIKTAVKDALVPIVIDRSLVDWNSNIAGGAATQFPINNGNKQVCSSGAATTVADAYVVQSTTQLCFMIHMRAGFYFSGASETGANADFFLQLSATCGGIKDSKIFMSKLQPGISIEIVNPTYLEFCLTDPTLWALPEYYKVHIAWTDSLTGGSGNTGSTPGNANKESCYQLVKDSTSTGSGVEDPHITSWDGLASTVFHEGDFVLTHVPRTGLAVHGRFCKSTRGPWASWTCAVAVRCSANEPMVEVVAAEWDDVKNPNTNVQTVANNVKRITCPSVGLNMLVIHHRFHRHPYVNFHVSLPSTSDLLSELRGLLGTANGNKEDDLQVRDGSALDVAGANHFIAHDSALVDAVHASWAVRPEEQLFSKTISFTGGQLASSVRPKVKAHPVARDYCRLAGLQTEVDLAICTYDLVVAHHLEGAKNLAETKKIIAIHG